MQCMPCMHGEYAPGRPGIELKPLAASDMIASQ